MGLRNFVQEELFVQPQVDVARQIGFLGMQDRQLADEQLADYKEVERATRLVD